MNDQLQQLNELLVLGAGVIARSNASGSKSAKSEQHSKSEQHNEQLMRQIEVYVDRFDRWSKVLEQGDYQPQESEVEVLRKLDGIHTQVLEVIENFKISTAKAIGELKNRGRRIMAYADQGPKKVSVRRPRRG